MEGGWLRLHRKIRESEVWGNPNVLKVWLYLLTKAAHKEVVVFMSVGHGVSKPVRLGPGQCVIGRLKGAEECDMSPSTFRNCVDALVTMGNVDKHSDKHWTVISINNWNSYQTDEEKKDKHSDKHRTSIGHIQELEELKKEEPFLVPPAPSAPEQPQPPKRRFMTQPEYEATLDGFNPDDAMRQRLEGLFPGIRIEVELAKWREYWRGSKRRALNLRSSFTNWCDKAFRMGLKYTTTSQPILSNQQVSQNKPKSESQLFMESLIQEAGVERVKKH